MIAAALQAIRSADPAFDSEALLRQLPSRFLAARRARADGDEQRLRAYVGAALLAEWSAGPGAPDAPDAGDARASGEADDLSVQEVRLVWAEHAPREDRLTVGIDCMSEVSGQVHTLTEYWTLARPAGAVTSAAEGVEECPNCGAPTVGEDDLCRYCGAALPGPLQDWLLERVDEDIDWYEGPAV